VHVEYATLALFAGLIVGATTWGILADIIGRRLSFNITLFIAGVFGIAAGGGNDFITTAALIACVGFGVGGK
jgi:MFS family permease